MSTASLARAVVDELLTRTAKHVPRHVPAGKVAGKSKGGQFFSPVDTVAAAIVDALTDDKPGRPSKPRPVKARKAFSDLPHHEQTLTRDLVRRHATGESPRQLAANTNDVSETKVRELLKVADSDAGQRVAFARQAGLSQVEADDWARDSDETMAQLLRRVKAEHRAKAVKAASPDGGTKAPKRMPTEGPDRDKVVEGMARRYLHDEDSLERIAEDTGYSKTTIHKALVNFGVQLRPRGSTPRPRKEAAPKARASSDEVAARLAEIDSRDAAREYLDSLSLSADETRRLAHSLNTPIAGVSRKSDIRDRIVEHAVGFRLAQGVIRTTPLAQRDVRTGGYSPPGVARFDGKSRTQWLAEARQRKAMGRGGDTAYQDAGPGAPAHEIALRVREHDARLAAADMHSWRFGAAGGSDLKPGDMRYDVTTGTTRPVPTRDQFIGEEVAKVRAEHAAKLRAEGVDTTPPTPAAKAVSAEDLADRAMDATTKAEVVEILREADAPTLRRVAKEIGADFPRGMRDPGEMRAHLANLLLVSSESAPTPGKKATPAEAATAKATVDTDAWAAHVTGAASPGEIVDALDAEPALTAPRLRELAARLGVDVPANIHVKADLQMLIAQRAPRGGPSTPRPTIVGEMPLDHAGIAGQVVKLDTEPEVVAFLDANPRLGMRDLRRVAAVLQLPIPPSVKTKRDLQLHIATVLRLRGRSTVRSADGTLSRANFDPKQPRVSAHPGMPNPKGGQWAQALTGGPLSSLLSHRGVADIARALDRWVSGEGDDDPLASFDEPRLRRASRAMGLPDTGTRPELSKRILDEVRRAVIARRAAARDRPTHTWGTGVDRPRVRDDTGRLRDIEIRQTPNGLAVGMLDDRDRWQSAAVTAPDWASLRKWAKDRKLGDLVGWVDKHQPTTPGGKRRRERRLDAKLTQLRDAPTRDHARVILEGLDPAELADLHRHMGGSLEALPRSPGGRPSTRALVDATLADWPALRSVAAPAVLDSALADSARPSTPEPGDRLEGSVYGDSQSWADAGFGLDEPPLDLGERSWSRAATPGGWLTVYAPDDGCGGWATALADDTDDDSELDVVPTERGQRPSPGQSTESRVSPLPASTTSTTRVAGPDLAGLLTSIERKAGRPLLDVLDAGPWSNGYAIVRLAETPPDQTAARALLDALTRAG